MLGNSVATTETKRKIDARHQGREDYPCCNDQVVIGLKARRLGQMARKQPQDDSNGSEGKTDVVRNQDLTRQIVAGVRKLVLGLAGARDQGGWHFVLLMPTSKLQERART